MNDPIYLEPKQIPEHLRGSGKKYRAIITESVTVPSHSGNWDGGSRTIFSAIELATGKTKPLSNTMAAPWDTCRADKTVPLKSGFAVIEHSIFCGKDMGPIFHLHPKDVAQFKLASPVELDEFETVVLIATRSFKSSYNGKDRYLMAMDECQWKANREAFSREKWDAAKARLIERKLLNKAGSITVAGKNAVGSQNL